jgi:hypothetical protein
MQSVARAAGNGHTRADGMPSVLRVAAVQARLAAEPTGWGGMQ